MSRRRKGVFCHERAPASLLSHREPDAEFLRCRAGTLLHPARPELPDTQPRKGAGRRTVPPHDDAGALTEAGRALLPHAENIYRGILNARTALKGFGTHHTLTLRLPPVLLQRDPIYPILMARLHAALPGYEFKVDTTPVPSSYHHMLCTEADAALYLPFGPLPPEIRCETIIGNRFYLIAAPEHPFSGQSSVELSDLAGQQIFYEPLYQDMVDFARKQPGMPYSTPVWRMVENYESAYAELLAGRGMFLCPMIYPAFPAGWHIPLHLSIPDTRLLTLRDDPRPEICTLRRVFAEVYAEREKLIKAL